MFKWPNSCKYLKIHVFILAHLYKCSLYMGSLQDIALDGKPLRTVVIQQWVGDNQIELCSVMATEQVSYDSVGDILNQSTTRTNS